MKQSAFPLGWNEKRVKCVPGHYESQSENKAAREDLAGTMMEIPKK